MKSLPGAALGLMAVCGSLCFAQTSRLELTLAGGYANPIGPAAGQLGGAASLDAAALYNATPRLSLGLETGYIFNPAIKGTGATQPTATDAYASIFHLTPEIKYGFPMEWKRYPAKPYVIAGAGFYWTHVDAGTYQNSGLTRAAASTDNANAGINAGAGVDVTVRENVSVGFDLRYHCILYRHVNNVQFLIPSLKLSVLWAAFAEH
jgi:outer membrane protein W